MENEQKILIIGDLLIDTTCYVKVDRISPEAPIPVASIIDVPTRTPGGAGLGAAFAGHENIPVILSTWCDLATKIWLEDKFNITKVQSTPQDINIEPITKTRYIHLESGYHLLRVDTDSLIQKPFSRPEEFEAWQNTFRTLFKEFNIGVAIILDYRKGFLESENTVNWILDLIRSHKIPVYVDSRSKKLSKYNNIDILKLNEKEFIAACEAFSTTDSNLDGSAPYQIIEKLQLKYLIVTRGPKGAYKFKAGQLIPKKIYTPPCSGFPDVTGCGDVFDVTFCYHWGIKKESPYDALIAAVNRASRFAYEPVEERLRCPN